MAAVNEENKEERMHTKSAIYYQGSAKYLRLSSKYEFFLGLIKTFIIDLVRPPMPSSDFFYSNNNFTLIIDLAPRLHMSRIVFTPAIVLPKLSRL